MLDRRAVKTARSSVAVDDAEGDDDGHAEEDRDGEYQPAVLELPRHDRPQEDRARPVVVVAVVAAASPAAPPGWALAAPGAAAPA